VRRFDRRLLIWDGDPNQSRPRARVHLDQRPPAGGSPMPGSSSRTSPPRREQSPARRHHRLGGSRPQTREAARELVRFRPGGPQGEALEAATAEQSRS
jgi:hypothetical protein